MQQQDKELFQDYEIRNWNYSPRLYKILAGAAVFNLLAVFVIGQADILTTRGCDSPMVSRVCQVIDTIYIGGKMLGTDSEFVSKDYEKNELDDADITYIDVSGVTPPLTYPEGYFAIANPEDQFAAMQNPADFSMTNPIPGIPGFPTNPAITGGTDLLAQPQVTPTPNNNAIIGVVPDKPFSMSDDNPIATTPPVAGIKRPRVYRPKQPKINNRSPRTLPNFDDELTAKNQKEKEDKPADKNPIPVESDAVKEVEINKKPFEELGDNLNVKLAKKEVDLSKPFTVVLDGTIAADGKLDSKKSKFVKFEGDEQMVNVAKEVIEAVGNSGFLGYLKNIGVDKVKFTLVQDDKQILVSIVSSQKDDNQAKSRASSFNALLSGLMFADANGLRKLDENSKTLVKNSKVTSDGKNFVFNFELPKPAAQDLINRTLKERAEKKANQPNSSADINSNSNAVLNK
ncbi:MAG: hypothetical protein M3R11_08040 [Acidobacteriota bacterium]|nr:hypothetical protein [Acidobacteriota bacterium]